MNRIGNKIGNVLFCCLPLILGSCGSSTEKERYVGSVTFPEGISVEQKAEMAGKVVPSDRQLEWQKMEFTCFICYGINTFTDREWGTGKEDPTLFNPTELDAGQWVKIAKEAGMKMILLTCKHHDGFCLWPSKYTDFSVASTPWKGGKGDLVREVSEACKREGLKFAVYLSPWDMNHPDYGTERYNDYFVNQLTELLTDYGKVDEVWFDGACGEGPNGKKQVYDFQRYYETIRHLQPNAVIAVMGPDVRWVGTESGYGRDTEWSVIPASDNMLAHIANSSQKEAGSGTFVPDGDAMQKDLGSRSLLKDAKGVIWYPSEVDVSIRPGWYYHQSQDDKVKSPQKLIDIYYSSVGKNSLLLLNLPPDKRGLIHETDRRNLLDMRRILDDTFSENYMLDTEENFDNLTDKDLCTFWSDESNVLTVEFNGVKTFDRVVLQENITEGQRIEDFTLEYREGDDWKVLSGGTTIGFKRILRIPVVTSKAIRLKINQSRGKAQVSEFGVFMSSKEESVDYKYKK